MYAYMRVYFLPSNSLVWQQRPCVASTTIKLFSIIDNNGHQHGYFRGQNFSRTGRPVQLIFFTFSKSLKIEKILLDGT